MSVKRGSVHYGRHTIEFSIGYAPRKKLEIAVLPGCQVVIKAPLKTAYPEIEKRVLKRGRWIVKQLQYFRQFQPRTPARSYNSGETHLYLGRRYRLKARPGQQDSIKLVRGYFQITVKGALTPERIKQLLDRWYARKTRDRLKAIYDACWTDFDKKAACRPRLSIRSMKTRWGSLSRQGALTLNSKLIHTPRECIEYVIVHELCHLKFHDHGTGFFRILRKKMPDWEKRKNKLELSLM